MNKLERIATFFKASPMQQLPALGICMPCSFYTVYNNISLYSNGDNDTALKCSLYAITSLALMACGEYLALEKLHEYDEVLRSLKKHGWNRRIIKTKQYSWCQRHIAKMASKNQGLELKTREYLHGQGYRWYHFTK